jgi:hypothetical protein
MRFRRWFLVLLLFVPLPVQARGLAEIDRTIRKEPNYRGKPRYCLLVFGPKAEAKVWLVRVGDRLYVDKNGNGDLTEAGECVAMSRPSSRRFLQTSDAPEVALVIAGRRWGKMQLSERRLHPEFKPLDENERQTWQRFQRVEGGMETIVEVSELPPSPRGGAKPFADRIRQVAGWDTTGPLAFTAQPKDAPILHFDGPLTLRLPGDEPPKWEKTDKPFDFQISVGTLGLGIGTFAALDYMDAVPDEAHPVAEVDFPSTTEAKPVHVRWVLKQRC